MAVSMVQQMMSALPQLRYQPTHKHVRVRLDAGEVADTHRAMLIWEPMRIVPSYAVPEADLSASLSAATPLPVPEYRSVGFGPDSPPLLDPSVPFDVHTAEGEPLTIATTTARREAAAFRLADPDLGGYVVLDFDAFDWWDDVAVDLRPGTLRTTCAYKGHATHYSPRAGDHELADIAWSYEDPLDDAPRSKG